MNDKQVSPQENGGKEQMTQRSIIIELNLWNMARRKAIGLGSLSEIIRKLIRLWVEGKINLDNYKD